MTKKRGVLIKSNFRRNFISRFTTNLGSKIAMYKCTSCFSCSENNKEAVRVEGLKMQFLTYAGVEINCPLG